MAGATTTTLALAIKKFYEPSMPKTFYEGTPLLQTVGMVPYQGGNAMDWFLNYAGNAAIEQNEGDAFPAAGNQSFIDLTVAYKKFSNVVQFTGEAKDAMKGGNFDGIKAELDGGLSGLMHKIEEGMVTLLEGAIDDSTNYAGKARATYGMTSEVVAGGSAALTLAMLSEAYETLQLDPRGVVFNPSDHMIISAPEQATAYTEVGTGIVVSDITTADTTAVGVNRPYVMDSNNLILDAGLMKHNLFYNKIPWITLPTITNSIVMLTRRSDIKIEEVRAVQIEQLAKTDDSDTFAFTWRGGLRHRDPYRAAKIEALTT